MTCKDCEYLGCVFEHLKGHLGFEEWRHCNYPVPFWVMNHAIPIDLEHQCKLKKVGSNIIEPLIKEGNSRPAP